MATAPPLSRVIELAEPSAAWEKILAKVPASQRRLAKVDDEAAARVIQAYQSAREQLSHDLDRLWAQTFASGVEPSIDEKVRFASKVDQLGMLEARQSELSNGTIGAIQHAYDGGVIESITQNSLERAAMAQQFPALKFMDPFTPPPGLAEEVYVNKAVQDATSVAQSVRDQASLALTTSALAGEGIQSMQKRLRPIFDGNARRAELTSRYVSIKAYNEASKVHYGEMNEVIKPYGRTVNKMWVATTDDRSCPICLALHGTVVAVEADFDYSATFDTRKPPKTWPEADSLEEPPRHTRCRCTITAWVDGWEHGTLYTPQKMQADARALAQAAGYDPPPAVVRGAGTPKPRGKRLHATQLRQVPSEAFSTAKARYLACAFPGVPAHKRAGLVSAHSRGPAAVQRFLDGG